MYKATADRLPPFAACIIFPISLYLISAQMSNAADAQKQHRDAPLRTPGAASHDTAQHSCRMPRAALLYATLIFRFTHPTRLPVSAIASCPTCAHALARTYAKAKALAAARAFAFNKHIGRSQYKLILSIASSSSAENEVFLTALILSSICSGFDAPIRTDVTTPSLRTHASAISARV